MFEVRPNDVSTVWQSSKSKESVRIGLYMPRILNKVSRIILEGILCVGILYRVRYIFDILVRTFAIRQKYNVLTWISYLPEECLQRRSSDRRLHSDRH